MMLYSFKILRSRFKRLKVFEIISEKRLPHVMKHFKQFTTPSPKIPLSNFPPPSLCPPPPFQSSSFSFRLLLGLNPVLCGQSQVLSLCTNSASLLGDRFFKNMYSFLQYDSKILIILPKLTRQFCFSSFCLFLSMEISHSFIENLNSFEKISNNLKKSV